MLYIIIIYIYLPTNEGRAWHVVHAFTESVLLTMSKKIWKNCKIPLITKDRANVPLKGKYITLLVGQFSLLYPVLLSTTCWSQWDCWYDVLYSYTFIHRKLRQELLICGLLFRRRRCDCSVEVKAIVIWSHLLVLCNTAVTVTLCTIYILSRHTTAMFFNMRMNISMAPFRTISAEWRALMHLITHVSAEKLHDLC